MKVHSARGAIEAWIVDDTGFAKKGRHSVGVAREYCGQLGKQDNCQVGVSLSVATAEASLPVAWRLCLPEGWAADSERRAKAGVPEEVAFRTKPRIALEQIAMALGEGVAPGHLARAAPHHGVSRNCSSIRRMRFRFKGLSPLPW